MDKVFLEHMENISVPEEVIDQMEEFQEMNMIYSSAIREVRTKLEVLNDEFRIKRKHNPIEYMKTRVKSVPSIMEKLRKKGYTVSIQSAKDNLNDIAGVRVICGYVKDIYSVAEMLVGQDDITLVEVKDYIKDPKPNGYRSLHLVVEVPVFFSDRKQPVRVEVQIRTIAMDFWASLEHQLHYKTAEASPDEIVAELKDCADVIASTDLRMQSIHDTLKAMEEEKKY
jgi:putative GTP pyrophosphokinase